MFIYPQLSFTHQKLDYCCYDIDNSIIEFKLLDFPVFNEYSEFSNWTGLNEEKLEFSKQKWNGNEIKIPIPSFLELFKEHILAPFFILQIFCVALWSLDEYWYYSIFTLVMLIVFESTLVNQRKSHLKTLNEMRPAPYTVYTYRDVTNPITVEMDTDIN